jgi:hypothetical protein
MPLNLTDKEIKLNLIFLHSKLPKNPTAVVGFYKLPKHFYENVIKSNFSEASLQEISNHMGYFLGVFKSVKITFIEQTSDPRWIASSDGTILNNNTDLSYSGLYRSLGRGHSEIYLIKKNKYQFKHIMAILAHEYTHHYLYLHNVKKNDVQDNEILTEVASAYLGLGQYLVDGYGRIVWSSDEYAHSLQLGYVNPETIKRVIYLSVKLRKWDPKEVVSSFSSFSDRINASVEMWFYKRRVKKAKRQEEKIIAESRTHSEKAATIKQNLIKLKENLDTIQSNFSKISNAVELESIPSKDGIIFMEIANEISIGALSDKLEYLLSNIEGNEDMASLSEEVAKLSNPIEIQLDLLNKYLH